MSCEIIAIGMISKDAVIPLIDFWTGKILEMGAVIAQPVWKRCPAEIVTSHLVAITSQVDVAINLTVR